MSQLTQLFRGVGTYVAAAAWNLGLLIVLAAYTGLRTGLTTWPGNLAALTFVLVAAWLIVALAVPLSPKKRSLGMALIALALVVREAVAIENGTGPSLEVLTIAFLLVGALFDRRAEWRGQSG